MRGSVTPKRWILLVALVGLISAFAAGYSAKWSGSAWADTTGGTTDGGTTGGTTGGDTPTPTSTPSPTPTAILTGPQDVLYACLASSSLVLTTGQQVTMRVYLLNSFAFPDDRMPGIAYFNSASGGTVSPASGTGMPVINYTAPSSSGSFTIGTIVQQNGVTICDFTTSVGYRNTKVNVTVNAPPAAVVPTPKPTNPVGIPVPTIVAQDPKAELSVVTPADGGSVVSKTIPGARVNIPPGAVSDYAGVQIKDVDISTLPEPPPGLFKFGGTVLDIKITDKNGKALDSAQLNFAAEICIPYTAKDAAAALGGVAGMAIYRYNAVAKQWIPLISTVDPVNKVICTNSANFSFFALGLKPAPTGTATPVATPVPPTPVPPTATPTRAPTPQPTATAVPPATGDFSANSGTLAGVALFGIALILAGIVAMRRTRKTSS